MEKTTQRKMATHLAAVTLTAIMSVFVVSNGVALAVTGETWVEKAIVFVNGEPNEVTVTTTDADGVSMESTDFMVGDTSVMLEAPDVDGVELDFPDELLNAEKELRIQLDE